MSFLFPLFLIAGLSLAIPIIIHLFNFRKYKKVVFSDTRLLQQVNMSTRKSKSLKNKLLLATRLLFLTALVVAFAQPYWGADKSSRQELVLLYLDNSLSMSGLKGNYTSIFQQAKDEAKGIIAQLPEDQQIIILSNDNTYASRPINKQEALKRIEEIAISAKTTDLKQIIEAVNNAISDNNAEEAKVIMLSDMQKSTLLRSDLTQINKNISFNIIPYTQGGNANIYIDTAFFTNPVIDTRQQNPLVLRIGKSNSKEPVDAQVQIAVNGQIRTAKTIRITSDSLQQDTVALMINTPGWHQIEIIVKDAPVQFDDTFRIAAKTNANLSVLYCNNGKSNPYIQAALSPVNGFSTRNTSIEQLAAFSSEDINLIVLHNVASLNNSTASIIRNKLDEGQSILIIPGAIQNMEAFNEALSHIAPIRFADIDTQQTAIAALQTEHPILKGMIAALPANVQLPLVRKHYPLSAGITANQQTVLSLKNGKPFLAQYSAGKGQLFILASPLDESAGNFVLSNLFLPILYKMCAISGSQSIYALNANSRQPIFIPEKQNSRAVYKAWRADKELIPPQQAQGNGTNVYLGAVISEPGFYKLGGESRKDSICVAVNADVLESRLEPASQAALEQLLQPAKVHWGKPKASAAADGKHAALWRWFVIIALAALALETFLLIKGTKKSA